MSQSNAQSTSPSKKYCSVRDSLDPAIPIEWTLLLNEDRGTA